MVRVQILLIVCSLLYAHCQIDEDIDQDQFAGSGSPGDLYSDPPLEVYEQFAPPVSATQPKTSSVKRLKAVKEISPDEYEMEVETGSDESGEVSYQVEAPVEKQTKRKKSKTPKMFKKFLSFFKRKSRKQKKEEEALKRAMAEKKSQNLPPPEYQPSPQPGFQPAPQPRFEPAPQPRFQPTSQPRFEPAPQPRFQPAPQPRFEPAPQPRLQPAPQPRFEPSSQPRFQPVTQPRFYLTTQPIPGQAIQRPLSPVIYQPTTPVFRYPTQRLPIIPGYQTPIRINPYSTMKSIEIELKKVNSNPVQGFVRTVNYNRGRPPIIREKRINYAPSMFPRAGPIIFDPYRTLIHTSGGQKRLMESLDEMFMIKKMSSSTSSPSSKKDEKRFIPCDMRRTCEECTVDFSCYYCSSKKQCIPSKYFGSDSFTGYHCPASDIYYFETCKVKSFVFMFFLIIFVLCLIFAVLIMGFSLIYRRTRRAKIYNIIKEKEDEIDSQGRPHPY